MLILHLIKYYQYDIYELLDRKYDIDTTSLYELDEDEDPSFIYHKKLMEERRAITL